jgi:drug/metabolite transporter (DMT)-like permease
VSLLFALAAALSNALNVVSQHVASISSPPEVKGWRLGIFLVRQPLWLFGSVAMLGAFVFQAVALYNGRLSVVQSLMVTELVFALVLQRLWLRQAVNGGAWLSATVTSVGLAVFLVMSEPQGGHPQPTAGAWISAIATMAAIIVACVMLAATGSPVRRAAFYAIGSGIAWATVAAFIKSTTNDFSGNGLLGMLQTGSIYAVVASGIAGTILTQAALHAGPLSVSQSLMVTVDPLVSVILGVWLFGEHFRGNPARIIVGGMAFAVMAAGVVFMTRTSPEIASSRAPPAPKQQ